MNNINTIITVGYGTKYMILDQGNYDNKYYYLTSRLDEEDNLTGEFDILEYDDGIILPVSDEELVNALVEYFKKRFEVVA